MHKIKMHRKRGQFCYFLMAAFGLLISVSSFAQTGAGANSDKAGALVGNTPYKFEATLSGGFLGFSKSSGSMDLAPSFYYKLLRSDLLQVGGEIGYQSVSHQGATVSNMAILAGVAVNVGNLSSAFYCMMGMALKSGSSGTGGDPTATDPNGFGYHFLCGKRIPIGGSQSWVFKPNIGVIAGGTSGMVFRPLAVSFLF